MKTHLDFVYDHEAQRPDEVWLVQPMGDGTVREITWRQALDEARRMAAYLQGLDLPKQSQIAIFAKNNAWWFISDLAIWMAGHVSVPLYTTLTAATIRQVLEHSEARAIMIGKLDGFEAMEPGIPDGIDWIAMPLAPAGAGKPWAEIMASNAPVEGHPVRESDDLATIVYTSGSTGVPKGVMHSFRTMAAAFVFTDRLEQMERDRVLSYLPLAHVYERAAIETCSMKSAMRVYFAESLDTFIDDLRRARPTLFVSVPRLWLKFQQKVFEKLPPAMLDKMLADPAMRDGVRKKVLDAIGLGEVRHAATGSAPIPDSLLEWYRSLGLELFEGYAMTENFCVSHATRVGELRLGYVGRPVDTVEQRITDDGEVLVKSPGTMLGYFKAQELTDEVLGEDGFLRTGDRGVVDEIGRLKITGRVKELFKTSKGKYVAPAPIETNLLQHDDIEQALVSGLGMPQPFAMVVLSDAVRAKLADAAVRAQVTHSLAEYLAQTNKKLDPHEQLEKLVVIAEPWTIENAMLTPTMKVKRSVIEERYVERFEAWYAAADPVVFA